ncbi:hypothetical protein [Anaerotruncus sp. DFI.9.16]|uniref:hypothetical protein n=1 Tax=Anaerotruncus sp. DFI.9.16 TaxID=2965275 RepID=UPI00210B11A9|nr:hypothetical protein [Anaerotruncus sp. DFI.9.16]MCQ4897471.1 hypothetical protein [Anaerotruncus sp. DFI.9.16]
MKKGPGGHGGAFCRAGGGFSVPPRPRRFWRPGGGRRPAGRFPKGRTERLLGPEGSKLPFSSHKIKKTPIDYIKNNSAKYLKCSVKSIFTEDKLYNLRLVTEKVA